MLCFESKLAFFLRKTKLSLGQNTLLQPHLEIPEAGFLSFCTFQRI